MLEKVRTFMEMYMYMHLDEFVSMYSSVYMYLYTMDTQILSL
jgi:hypothetical protein